MVFELLKPLTHPVPTVESVPGLIEYEHLATVHDLIKNPYQFSKWRQHIAQIREEVSRLEREGRGKGDYTDDAARDEALLGAKLASSEGRLALQKLTDVYERALQHFPTSYALWSDYLALRASYVLGKAAHSPRLNAPRKKNDATKSMSQFLVGRLKLEKEISDETAEDDENLAPFINVSAETLSAEEVDTAIGPWTGALDGYVGYKEWFSLAALYERAIVCLPNLPRLWLSYLTLLTHPNAPSPLTLTLTRRTLDRALKTLPPSLHARLWRAILGSISTSPTLPLSFSLRLWNRYLAVDSQVAYYYAKWLIAAISSEESERTQHAPAAASLLLSLAIRAHDGADLGLPVSGFQLLSEFVDTCAEFAEEIDTVEGLVVGDKGEKTEEKEKASDSGKPGKGWRGKKNGYGNPGKTGKTGKTEKERTEALVNTTPEISVEEAVKTFGLDVYKDQAGKLWTGLATYYIRRGDIDDARRIFDEGMKNVVTVRDFTQIFDACTEFCEGYIAGLMEELEEAQTSGDGPEGGEGGEGGDPSEIAQLNAELDARMQDFETLMDTRPFLVNDVLLRRNPSDVQEWEKRVALHGADDTAVAETYQRATQTIDPKKATANYGALWVHFATFYETKDGTESARKVFERATTIPFRAVNDLAEIWCEWAELELRAGDTDAAVRVLQRALKVPNRTDVNFYDDTLPPQKRLFKSLKLWSYYVDLEEAVGSVESVRAAYDRMLELKIATAQIVINYANFLEEHHFFEDSFRVFERALEQFTYPVAFELWNTYLYKFTSRYGGEKLERTRDLFEQALANCPSKLCLPLYLMYGHLEEEHGLARRAMRVYERATRAVPRSLRLTVFMYYLAKVASFYGLPATRPVYERALQVLPDADAVTLCLRFAAMETKLGEIDRARGIYAYASQMCDPRTNAPFWGAWRAFELETGSEETFREFLRIKRAVQAAFNTEASYVAAEGARGRKGAKSGTVGTGGGVTSAPDAMAALDSSSAPAFVAASTNPVVDEKDDAEIEIEVESDDE